MLQIITLALVFTAAIGIMAAALHYSKYKRRQSACCGGGHCDSDHEGSGDSCYSSKTDFVKQYGERKIKTEHISA
jgi:hypothetical protein